MSDPVFIVSPDTPAEDAWQLMRTRGVRHLVVKEESKVVGILSESDAGGPSGTAVRAGAIVSDLMDPHFVTIGRDDTVRSAANLMRGRGLGCLPVVHRGKLVGVVTIADMLAVIGGGVDRPSHEKRAAMHHRVPHRRANAATGRW
jgi:acetoin utilization protein AcuB